MATYKEIKGKTIQSLASDLDLDEAEGQIWFNTTSFDFKTIAKVAGSWSTGGTMPGTKAFGGSAGTQTSQLFAGGTPVPPANTNQVDTSFEYDGTSWTGGGALNTTRFAIGGFGAANTAAIMAGGAASPSSTNKDEVESYNGTSFTEETDINTARGDISAVGIKSDGLVSGGAGQTNTETWDESSWTNVNAMNVGDINAFSAGVSTAAIQGGGQNADGSAVTATVEQWDGTSWTEITDFNTARERGGGSGTSTLALFYGGTTANGAKTEFWDGASWTEFGDLATARIGGGFAPSGTSVSALYAGGYVTAGVDSSEEWDWTAVMAAGAWATGNALNQVRGSNKGFGPQTAAITTGGAHENPGATPATQKCEQYDGTSWSEVSDTTKGRQSFGSLGTTTAGFMVGGGDNEGTYVDDVESWNGASWSETTDINTARTSLNGSGSTTAALVMGGYIAPPALEQDIVESWNGTSWTEAPDMNTRRRGLGNAQQSPSTDTIAFGGNTQPPPNTANAETWDGSSWSETGDLSGAKDNMSGTGASSTAALCFGGRTTADTEEWNGTAWSEVANLSLARGYAASAGASSQSALIAGGEAPGAPYYKGNTEEWTQSRNVKVITD